MKVITWKNPDGTISITYPVEPRRSGEPEGTYLDRIAARADMPDAQRLPDHDTAALKALGLDTQEAWEWNGAALVVNPAKATPEALAAIRQAKLK